jgi:fucose permease
VQVSDIEPVLQLLESQEPSDAKTWQTRYVLLVWLSIIVMMPVHMSRLDSFKPEDRKRDEGRKTIMERYAYFLMCSLGFDRFIVYKYTCFRYHVLIHHTSQFHEITREHILIITYLLTELSLS